MQPLILPVTVFLLLILPLGWWTALRVALTATFLLTASAHWGTKRRDDLIRMVPAALPRPDLLGAVTGNCEILGAVELLISRVAPVAALGLTPLLIAIFPPNVRATSPQRCDRWPPGFYFLDSSMTKLKKTPIDP